MNFVRLSHDRVSIDVDRDVSTAILLVFIIVWWRLAVETSWSTSKVTLSWDKRTKFISNHRFLSFLSQNLVIRCDQERLYKVEERLTTKQRDIDAVTSLIESVLCEPNLTFTNIKWRFPQPVTRSSMESNVSVIAMFWNVLKFCKFHFRMKLIQWRKRSLSIVMQCSYPYSFNEPIQP